MRAHREFKIENLKRENYERYKKIASSSRVSRWRVEIPQFWVEGNASPSAHMGGTASDRTRAYSIRQPHARRRRVGVREFRHDGVWVPRIVAIDKRGEIRRDADLVMVEVEMLDCGPRSEPHVVWIGWKSGRQAVPCPDAWLKGEIVNFHGPGGNA